MATKGEGIAFDFKVRFLDWGDRVTCVIHANGWKIKATQELQQESDRISPIKRAKQKAFIRAMAQFNGKMCSEIKINT